VSTKEKIMNKLKLSILSLAIALSSPANPETQTATSIEKVDDNSAYSFNVKFSGNIAPQGPLSFGSDLKIETETKLDREQITKSFLAFTDAYSKASKDEQLNITKNFANSFSKFTETTLNSIKASKSDFIISQLEIENFSNTIKDEIVLKSFSEKLANELKNNITESPELKERFIRAFTAFCYSIASNFTPISNEQQDQDLRKNILYSTSMMWDSLEQDAGKSTKTFFIGKSIISSFLKLMIENFIALDSLSKKLGFSTFARQVTKEIENGEIESININEVLSMNPDFETLEKYLNSGEKIVVVYKDGRSTTNFYDQDKSCYVTIEKNDHSTYITNSFSIKINQQ